MKTMQHHLLNTQLQDRTLWYDGDVTFPSHMLNKFIDTYDVKYVDKMTPEIVAYNANVDFDQQICVKDTCNKLNFDWNIPQEYRDLDILTYVCDKHTNMISSFPKTEVVQREKRIAEELVLYKKYNLYDVLRVIIYIINTLTAHNVVWGVGRGSSVSSYLLYIIGVHDVDSYKYQLDITDFLHD